MNGVLFADNQYSLQPCPIDRARPLLPGFLIAKKPNASDERVAERRHRQSEGIDALWARALLRKARDQHRRSARSHS